jgi:serine/threonine protein kinase
VTTLADSSPPGEWYCPSCEKQFSLGDRCPDDGTRLVKLAVRIDPFIGRELDGRYTIIEKLGQGGMGAVYRSSQHSVGRDCAIKVINATLVSEPDVIKRFLREAKLASRLAHPNAVAVLDFGQTEDGVFYLVMELVEGRTLDAVFRAEKSFKPERVVRIGSQVCDALEGAHALSIVHRDLKPSNIMLLNRGRDLVKVLDFGLAKSVAPDQTSTTMTNAGQLLGTPAFMPPELALGQPCDGRADLYSLGCVLYLLGSGKLPFQSTSAHELIAMHASDVAPPMTGVPPALGRVIDRLLAKDPAARYQSAAETREALEAAVDGRLYTPVPGIPAVGDTNPSLGPFPKTTDDITALRQGDDALRTPTPRGSSRTKMSPTDIEKLVSGATLAAAGDTLTPTPSSAPTPAAVADSIAPAPRRRRWLLPALGGVVIAAGIGVLALANSGHRHPTAAPVDQHAQPAVVEQHAQPAADHEQPAAPQPAPPEPVDQAAKPPEPVAPVEATTKPVDRPHKAATRPRPIVKPVATKPVEPPHAGSNKPPAQLPF